MDSEHDFDDSYNLDNDKKGNMAIANLSDSDNIRSYYLNLRNEIRRIYRSSDDGNKLSQIDEELK
ncbi:hypothetical protein [Candidatus Nitrosocosmicus sp. SS]|jgi:hypothetical protein|uniref:hypothetical protein n=1 Tax=Candidatus Nitrosocosmicus agrestis TaxID=2563600 RepID=UPI00122E19C8|nr:hypothetical protein [Candidatus Nitrosocosmicus sp. SS]KAA2283572.1 hypothetical protein F1Z66_01465 [Candidatus Nitrosocosmicus sp. SS]KAF0869653.1 hypothetical protein E5N71_03995 [Candidatus Nitrosocosmicus sp. SS]